MVRHFQTLSAILFYILGASMFIAYILQLNDIAKIGMVRWMETADLPLLCTALLYGGSSIYLSLNNKQQESRPLLWTIIAIGAIIFLLAVILKFI